MTGRREGARPPERRLLSRFSRPALRFALLLACAAGCGGGMPLLHPRADAAPRGRARARGLQQQRGRRRAVERDPQRGEPGGGQPERAAPGNVTYAEGALVAASIGPGLAPIAGARVGVGCAEPRRGSVTPGARCGRTSGTRSDLRHLGAQHRRRRIGDPVRTRRAIVDPNVDSAGSMAGAPTSRFSSATRATATST